MLRAIMSALGVSLVVTLSASGSMLANPGFELEHPDVMPNGAQTDNHEAWGMPDGWSFRQLGPVNGHGVRRDDLVGWASEGVWSLYVFPAVSTPTEGHRPGDYLEFYQTVNLTDISHISFDVYLKGGSQYSQFYVAIDSEKLWAGSAAGFLRDVTIDVDHYTGLHTLAVGVEILRPFGSGGDGWGYFDHFVAIPEPAMPALLALSVVGLVYRRRSLSC